MSEKKSWDVVRKPSKAAEPTHPVATHAPTVSSLPRKAGAATQRRPLREKRKKQRHIFYIVLGILAVLLLAGLLYLIWLPALRVNAFDATGPDADGAKQVVARTVEGTYLFLIPRNSLFFLPENAMRKEILKEFPDVSAVSIKPSSLHGLTVTTTPREAAFVWCGASIDTPPADGSCFHADAEGLLFSPFDPATEDASSTLRIFAPLDHDIAAGDSPVRAHVLNPQRIPDALRFVKGLRGLGAPISALAIVGDEADLYVQGKTKILYVLGHEEQAMLLASSALPTLNFNDGTIDYIDLRFTTKQGEPSKVYVKRFGQ
jgi:hypothetical protein